MVGIAGDARGPRDPRRIADVVLAAAVRATADAVYVEPRSDDPENYSIAFERSDQVIAQVDVDFLTGAAVVARLAIVAAIELPLANASSALVRVRTGERDADVIVTIRPGVDLRADLVLLKRGRMSKPTATTVEVGSVIGNYRLIERLGEGGMGTVYRAEHVVLGRAYALKVLRSPVFERDPIASTRFLREARAAARVRHPNIADVFDFGNLPDGRPYLVMELLEGESLADCMLDPFEPKDVVTIGCQLASALAAVHERGVVHADVTPSNALVVSFAPIAVKLIDFGLAAIAGEAAFEDPDGFVLGTPSYISPEQLRGLPATDRSDQYGLGCVLFALLTGHPPYEHVNIRELCLMHVHAPIPAVVSERGPLPPKLAEVITTCLQKSPQARFPGMRAMLAALEEIEQVMERRGWRRWLGS